MPHQVSVASGLDRLRRFDPADWRDPGDRRDFVARRVAEIARFNDARRECAVGLGFDPDAKYGEAPGRDWWACLAMLNPDGVAPQGNSR